MKTTEVCDNVGLNCVEKDEKVSMDIEDLVYDPVIVQRTVKDGTLTEFVLEPEICDNSVKSLQHLKSKARCFSKFNL